MKRRNSITSIKAQQELQTISRNKKQQATQFWEAADQFLRHCTIKGLSADTIKFYEKELRQTVRAFADLSTPLDDVRKIQTKHIEKFIEHQQDLGRAVSTINSRLRAGRTFFNFCLRKEYIKANPFDGVQQLKMRHEVGATFSKRQLKKLLDAPDITTFAGLRDLAVMLTFASTGIRLKETVTGNGTAYKSFTVNFTGVPYAFIYTPVNSQ